MNINEALIDQSGAEERNGYPGEGFVAESTAAGAGQDGAAHPLQRTEVQRNRYRNGSFTGTKNKFNMNWLHYVSFISFKNTSLNGLRTLPDTDSGTDSDSDSKPDGYIVLCKTCSHAQTRTRIPTPYYCVEQESESIPKSGNVFKPFNLF